MPGYLLLQLSDVHLRVGGVLSNGAPTSENLRRAIELILRVGLSPDLVVCSGDLADAGEGESYDELRARLAPLVARGASVVYLPGNHDERGAFRRHLLDDAGTGDGPINQVTHHGGLRVVALDTSVPGAEHGELAQETLAFLRAALADPAPDGTVLALHHPPVPSPIASMAEIALREPGSLADALGGSDVRLIVSGHNHHAAASALAGIPVWVSPALAYRGDVTSVHTFVPLPGAALSRIDLPAGGAPLVSVVEVPLSAARP